MTEKRWKREERRVAELLGAKRLPHGDPHAPDAQNRWLVIENKDRATLPQWLVAALATARGKATDQQLPLVTLTTPASRQIMVVLDIRDFRAWFGK